MKAIKFFGLATAALTIGWVVGGAAVLLITARSLARGDFDMDVFLLEDDEL